VDKPDTASTAADQDEAEEAGCGLVIAVGDTALLLEMADEAFDA
jgi:hypothetical protein